MPNAQLSTAFGKSTAGQALNSEKIREQASKAERA